VLNITGFQKQKQRSIKLERNSKFVVKINQNLFGCTILPKYQELIALD